MFRWFRATCPVDPAAKQWLEDRLGLLSEQFTSSAFTDKPVVLPTPEFFPDPYDGSEQTIRALLDRVCDYIGVAPNSIALELFSESRNLWFVDERGHALPNGAAGFFEQRRWKYLVRLEASEVGDPMALVATMAHELAHSRLLGEGRIAHGIFDNELLTDLTAVFHGFGVFLANSPRNWPGQDSLWPGTELRKPEYMTPPMFGYALAHLAWHREEVNPPWARYLCWGARANLKQGIRYLLKTGDSVFTPRRSASGGGG